MRTVNLVLLILALTSAFALYVLKYDTRRMEVRVQTLERSLDQAQEEIGAAQGEACAPGATRAHRAARAGAGARAHRDAPVPAGGGAGHQPGNRPAVSADGPLPRHPRHSRRQPPGPPPAHGDAVAAAARARDVCGPHAVLRGHRRAAAAPRPQGQPAAAAPDGSGGGRAPVGRGPTLSTARAGCWPPTAPSARCSPIRGSCSTSTRRSRRSPRCCPGSMAPSCASRSATRPGTSCGWRAASPPTRRRRSTSWACRAWGSARSCGATIRWAPLPATCSVP